jgi:carboxymethylenebutenolidase
VAVHTRTQQVAVPDGGRIDLYLFSGDEPGPGILLLQEIYGVGEFLESKARTLAGLGYSVGCPDVFWRVEPNVSLAHDEAGLAEAFGYMTRFAEVPSERTTDDLLRALDALRAAPEVSGPTAVMGYCLGGRLAYEVAAAGDPDACVAYYGSGIAAELDLAGQVRCPTLVHFGGDDPYIPTEDVLAVARAFSGRPGATVVVHGGAGHAFENSFAPMFSNPAAAAASWPVTTDFLARSLRG